MILDLFLLRVFHAPSCCSFTSNLTLFSLIIDYWIDNGIYSALIRIIIKLIIDKSRLRYKIIKKYWQKYSNLNYTRIKPRSRRPQKKSAYFTHPDFSAAKIEKKNSTQVTRANTVFYEDGETDRRTDRQDEGNSRFSQIFRKRLKMTNTTCATTGIPLCKCECMGNRCFHLAVLTQWMRRSTNASAFKVSEFRPYKYLRV